MKRSFYLTFFVFLCIFCCKKRNETSPSDIEAEYSSLYNAKNESTDLLKPFNLNFGAAEEIGTSLGNGMLIPLKENRVFTDPNKRIRLFALLINQAIYQVTAYDANGQADVAKIKLFLTNRTVTDNQQLLISVQNAQGKTVLGNNKDAVVLKTPQSFANLNSITAKGKISYTIPKTGVVGGNGGIANCPEEYIYTLVRVTYNTETQEVISVVVLETFCKLPEGGGAADPATHNVEADTALYNRTKSCLTETDRNGLANAIDSMLRHECTTSYFYKELVKKNISLGFCYDTTGNFSAAYRAGTDKIFFNGSFPVTYEYSVREELFHAYQDKVAYPGGIAQYGDNNQGSLEFEAYLFKELTLFYRYQQKAEADKFTGADHELFVKWVTAITVDGPPDQLKLMGTPPGYGYFAKIFSDTRNLHYAVGLMPKAIPLVMTNFNQNCN